MNKIAWNGEEGKKRYSKFKKKDGGKASEDEPRRPVDAHRKPQQ
jgi:hypothetical protein